MKIYNIGEISRILTGGRSTVTSKRGHIKHKKALDELKEFEKQWVEKWSMK